MRILPILVLLVVQIAAVSSFVTQCKATKCTPNYTYHSSSNCRRSLIVPPLCNGSNEGDNEDDPNDNDNDCSPIQTRFITPRLDDPGLPIADALVSGFVAPSCFVFVTGIAHLQTPSWLISVGTARGSLLAPTLSHGAGLACCWLLGALASRSYEKEAFDVSGGKPYSEVIWRVVKGGAFATGLLIFSTQIGLFLEFGRYVQYGESNEIDVRLATVTVELINDVITEALAIGGWRLYLASMSQGR